MPKYLNKDKLEELVNKCGNGDLYSSEFITLTPEEALNLVNLAVSTAIGDEVGTFVGDFNGDVNHNLFFSVKANSLPELGAKIYTVKEIK